jgi:hypothetical protein
LYSDYTFSDDNFYPETKRKVKESNSSSSDDSALSGSGYIINSDSDADMLIDTSSYVGDDDIYPLTRGEIEDDSRPPACKHCMMASHGDVSGSRVNGGRDRQTASGRVITRAQIRHTRRIYTGEIPLGPNPQRSILSLTSKRSSLIAKSGCWNGAGKKPTHGAIDEPIYRCTTRLAQHNGGNPFIHLGVTTSRKTAFSPGW